MKRTRLKTLCALIAGFAVGIGVNKLVATEAALQWILDQCLVAWLLAQPNVNRAFDGRKRSWHRFPP